MLTDVFASGAEAASSTVQAPSNGGPLQAPPAPVSTPTPTQAPAAQPAGAQGPAHPPAAMAGVRRWLLWRSERRPDGEVAKVPYYVGGGRRKDVDSPEDSAALATYAEARRQFFHLFGAYTGLGFALGDGWQGIDYDHISERGLDDLAYSVPSYKELSPSGSGLHAIGYGRPFKTLASNGSGIEAYSHGRFFTFTGNVLSPGPLVCLADYVEQMLVSRHSAHGPARADLDDEPLPDLPQEREDDEVMHSFWHARNAERFRALWLGDLSAEPRKTNGEPDYSRADWLLLLQLAFYTPNDLQLLRLFRASALGELLVSGRGRKDGGARQGWPYLCRTVKRVRQLHAVRLERIAAVQAAMSAGIDAALAARRST